MKTYILRTDNPRSIEYALTAAQSCENVGMKWEYFEGTQSKDGTPHDRVHHCSHGHYAIWKKIAEGEDESGIVFEHDAIMLHPIDMKIPDGYIVVLGYKVREPETYDHISAGPPKELIDIVGHHGAHAYAMTKKTAQMLLDEQNGNPPSDVDGTYFIRGTRRTSIPLKIMSPTPAVGWIRNSTIWQRSVFINYELIPSFEENYKPLVVEKQNTNIKTYILKIDDPISDECAHTAVKSCENIGMKWEYFYGNPPENATDWEKSKDCAYNHYAIWKKIAEGEEDVGVVFEHDAMLLHPINISIPDGCIVALGYKVLEPNTYDYEVAGPPKELIDIECHHGTHAYAITKNTAKLLLDEMDEPPENVDIHYFLEGRKTSVPLKIMSPTPALAWIRKSTIWDESVFINYELIPSFKDNYIKIDTDEQVATKWLPIEFHLRRKRLRIFFDTEENKNLVLKDITEFVKNEDELTIKGTCIVHGEITTMRVTFPKANYGPNKTLGENLLVRVMDNPDMDIKISAKTFDYDFSEYLNDK